MLDLQSRLIAANYIYIPPQTPPLEKVGLLANSQFATCGVGEVGDSGYFGFFVYYVYILDMNRKVCELGKICICFV